MTTHPWLTLVLLAGCAAAPPPEKVTRTTVTATATATSETRTVSPATAAATARYQLAEKQELPAVQAQIAAGTATPATIDRIHQADIAARAAVRNLVSMDGHPTEAAKAKLRHAMEELIASTEAK